MTPLYLITDVLQMDLSKDPDTGVISGSRTKSFECSGGLFLSCELKFKAVVATKEMATGVLQMMGNLCAYVVALSGKRGCYIMFFDRESAKLDDPDRTVIKANPSDTLVALAPIVTAVFHRPHNLPTNWVKVDPKTLLY